jgi:hypothetical protein
MLAIAALLWSLNSPATSQPTVAVRLYQPFADDRETRAVEAGVDRIFAKAGIAVRWVDCSASASLWLAASPCAHAPGPGDIILRVLDHSAAGRGACSQGLALLPGDGQMGVFATVFTDQLERMGAATDASRSQLLSHFAAHEIGHLLLASGHSGSGLMSAAWGTRDLDRAARGRLVFSPAEAERMRRNLAAAGPRPAVAPPPSEPAQGTNR